MAYLSGTSLSKPKNWGDLPLSRLEPDLEACERAERTLADVRDAVAAAGSGAANIALEITLGEFLRMLPLMDRKD